jgi:hypothetical protein
MNGEQRMKNVWTEFPATARPALVHSPDRPATFSIPRNFCGNTLIEQAIPELSRSGGSPISY